MLRAREEVAAWLGLGLTGPSLPAAPPPRREPPSRVPPEPDERVAGEVLIGRFPVTNAAFARFRPEHPRVADPQLADHPVVLVTRDDALAYCAWLGARLPTGAEWTRRRRRRRRGRGATRSTRRAATAPRPPGAGRRPCARTRAARRRAGAEQLAGNVWEWVADTRADGWGVLRGGCYLDTAHGVATRARAARRPARATATTGFRIAIDERREAWTGRS